MKQWINEHLGAFDFEKAPLTKVLMANYMSCMYEGDADYNEDSMRQELQSLHENNQLACILIQEIIDSPPDIE